MKGIFKWWMVLLCLLAAFNLSSCDGLQEDSEEDNNENSGVSQEEKYQAESVF